MEKPVLRWDRSPAVEERVEQLVAQLTLEDKVALVSGRLAVEDDGSEPARPPGVPRLALADSPNQHEAESAMREAQRLMLKYNIDQAAAEKSAGRGRDGAAPTKKYGYRHVGEPRSRIDESQRLLAMVLGRYFFVEAIWVPSFDARTGTPLPGKQDANEADVFSGVLTALGVDLTGSGLPDARMASLIKSVGEALSLARGKGIEAPAAAADMPGLPAGLMGGGVKR